MAILTPFDQNYQRFFDESPIITERPKVPQYALLHKRLESYGNWPTYRTQTPEKLSEAGFYYAGFNDNVKCFFCAGGLRNWEDGDDPWEEHAKWFPRCGYVRQCKPTIGGKKSHQKKPASLFESAAALAVKDIGYDEHIITLAFKKNFSNDDLGNNGKFNAVKLLEAIHIIEDEQKQPNSGSQLSLEEVQHTSLNVEQEKQVTCEAANEKLPSIENGAKPKTTSLQTHSTTISPEEKNLKKELREFREQRMCKICFENENNILLLPCAHLVCCDTCSVVLRECPVCRRHIKGTVKTFTS